MVSHHHIFTCMASPRLEREALDAIHHCSIHPSMAPFPSSLLALFVLQACLPWCRLKYTLQPCYVIVVFASAYQSDLKSEIYIAKKNVTFNMVMIEHHQLSGGMVWRLMILDFSLAWTF